MVIFGCRNVESRKEQTIVLVSGAGVVCEDENAPPNVRTNARTAQELAITHAQMGPMSESANCTSLFFRYSIDLTSRWLIRIRQGSRYTQRSRWQAPKERYGVQ